MFSPKAWYDSWSRKPETTTAEGSRTQANDPGSPANARMIRESKVDVLIIGAGPSGLMPCNIHAGQADGIQPRTIEVLQSYGLAERLLKEGNQMHMAAFYNPGKDGGIELTTRAPDVTAPTARYPFEVTLHQGAIESIFHDSMRSYGLEIERPVIPTSLEISTDPRELEDPNKYPVKVTVNKLDKEGDESVEVIRAKFVVGSDGAHSWIRKSLGIEMEGEQTDYIWGVVDFIPQTNFPDIRNRCAIHSNSGSCMIIPREGDKVRLYIQLSDPKVIEGLKTGGRVDKNKSGPVELLEAARKSFAPYTFETPDSFDWWTLYIIGQRVASKFSVHQRVFISGDACHTHSPKAGQGMNASMNDTHNLAWKLIHVLRGSAHISLLETYEFERRQYARDLINFDKKFSALFSGKPKSSLNLEGVTHEDFLKAFQTFGGFTSGIGVCYAPSKITHGAQYQSLASNVTIGARMPPQIILRAADSRPIQLQDLLVSDTKFKLFLFLGDLTDARQKKVVDEAAVVLPNVLSAFHSDIFDMVTISAGKKMKFDYTTVPIALRAHWTKVFIDDCDATGKQGGRLYEEYGIDELLGALVLVRPDGYVGLIAPLDGARVLDDYLKGFLTQL